jgi:hypothetical protein
VSINDVEAPVKWGGHTYSGIRRLGFTERGAFVIDLHSCPPPEPRGGYFTCLPISPMAYREKHGSGVMVEDHGKFVTLTDDWGRKHSIYARRSVLKVLLAECQEQKVPLAAYSEVG